MICEHVFIFTNHFLTQYTLDFVAAQYFYLL